MDLRWPWLLAGLVVVVLLLLAWWSRPARPTAPGDALLVAHAGRIRALPRYRALLRRQQALTAYRSVAVLVVVAGAILLAARPQSTTLEQPEERNRDIMLCLDGSSSMSEENLQVVAEFRRLVAGLEGERIGLTLFSGASITVFPLTDDYAFVQDQLDLAEQAFASDDYDYFAGIQLLDDRASQMGDGIVSCAQRFDRPDEERGRAVVVASDNDPQGPPVYTLAEAGEYAAQRDVVLHGIGSPDLVAATGREQEFADAMAASGGSFAILGADGATEAIVDRIQQLERRRIEQPPTRLVRDEPLAGTVVAGVGLLLLAGGWLAEAVLARRPATRRGGRR